MKGWTRGWKRGALGLVVLAGALAGTVEAHHGWSEYDAARTLTLSGTIAQVGYENPHGFVRLQVRGDKGEEPGKTWLAILAPPSRMQARGLAREALEPGTKATVVGYPHRSNPDELRAERITVGGKTTELR